MTEALDDIPYGSVLGQDRGEADMPADERTSTAG
jgi:hypothetical protein